jgi:hypothetical protein
MTPKFEAGTCKAIRDCDAVVRALQQDRNNKPTICDYSTRSVCCPSPVAATTQSGKVLSNRISAQSIKNYSFDNRMHSQIFWI